MKRHGAALGAVALALSTLVMGISPAGARDATSHLPMHLKGQSPMSVEDQPDYTTLVQSLRSIGMNDASFTAVHVEGKQVTLYRASAENAAAQLEGYYAVAKAVGVQLVLAQAILTEQEISQLDTLVGQKLKELDAAGVNVSMYGMTDGYDKPYVISYQPGSKPVLDSVVASFQSFGKGTVRFEEGGVVPLGRNADTNPFYGGSANHGTNGLLDGGGPSLCTNGFQTQNPSSLTFYTITAWHCNNERDPRFWSSYSGAGGAFEGSVTTNDPARDAAFINLSHSGHSGRPIIFDGGFGDDTLLKTVTGVTTMDGASLMCTSGATSGAVCDIIDGLPTTIVTRNAYSGATASVKVQILINENETAMVAGGDSGGIVFTNADNNTHAFAVGMIDAGLTSWKVPCPPGVENRAPGKVTCYSRAAAVEIQPMLEAHNLVAFGF